MNKLELTMELNECYFRTLETTAIELNNLYGRWFKTKEIRQRIKELEETKELTKHKIHKHFMQCYQPEEA